ncbi:hypothetical protein B0T17DRAFT_539230 [Bombardia bombarda]|uniref:Uncharacterized protein n=1 Tax=Bombardia bombarda TaxID=252184 RepID=A0AA40BW25_9PEZI|nr:hypothetical protein B0T17DRAFT_539230 [Bombardia bombarda]
MATMQNYSKVFTRRTSVISGARYSSRRCAAAFSTSSKAPSSQKTSSTKARYYAPSNVDTRIYGKAISPRVVEFARKYDIGYPGVLNIIRGRTIHGLTVAVSDRHTFHFYHIDMLLEGEAPDIDMYLSMYIDATAKPLWLYSVSQGEVSIKQVVKETAKKMASSAFIAALKVLGYDECGRALPYLGDVKTPNPRAGTELYGTVKLSSLKATEIVNVPKKVLVADLAQFIEDMLVPRLVRNVGGGQKAGAKRPLPPARIRKSHDSGLAD